MIDLLDSYEELEKMELSPIGKPIRFYSREEYTFNDFAKSFFCTNRLKFPDHESPEFMVDPGVVEITDAMPERMQILLMAREMIFKFIKTPAIPVEQLSVDFNLAVKDLFAANTDFVMKVYQAAVSIIMDLTEAFSNSAGHIVDYKTYRSYGRNPRRVYSTKIPFFTMSSDGTSTLWVDAPSLNKTSDHIHSAVALFENLRLVHLIAHFAEIGIRLDKINLILFPFKEHTGSLTIRDIQVTSNIRGLAVSFFKKDYTLHPNPMNCYSCKYRGECLPQDMVSMPALY